MKEVVWLNNIYILKSGRCSVNKGRSTNELNFFELVGALYFLN